METMTEDQRRLNEDGAFRGGAGVWIRRPGKKHVFHGHPLNRDAALTTLSELSAKRPRMPCNLSG